MTSVTTIQKLHALPYAKIYGMLEYKLAMHGITLAKQTEEYSSLQIPLHRITDSASNGSVFPVVTEHFSTSSDHAFL